MRLTSVFAGLLVLAIALSAPFASALAADYTIRLGYEDPPDLYTSPEHAFGVIFKSMIEVNSGGRIEVQLFPASQLGGSLQMTEMVQSGTLEAVIETGTLGNFYPAFEVINIPFLFENEVVAWRVLDGPFFRELLEDMRQQTGLRLLAMGQNGTRNFTNNVRPIRTPEDLEGLKIRVMQSPVFMEMVKSMGGNPVPIAWAEVYTSLQTGVADGQENPFSPILTGKLYEVQQYLTLDGHVWSEDALVINDNFYQSLPEDLQQVVYIAAQQGAVVNRAIETINSQYVGMQKVISEGMEIYVPTAEEKRQFAEAAQAPVLEWMRTRIDDKWVDGMLAAVEDARRELGLE